MAEQFEVRRILPAAPERVFSAWLSPREHAEMTGGAYRELADGVFTAWAGYIRGRTLESEPSRRIVQAWRTTEFPGDAPDSRLELVLSPAAGGTELILRHTDLPDGQGEAYASGWVEHYLEPMEEYFQNVPEAPPSPVKAPVKKAAAKKPADERAGATTAAVKTTTVKTAAAKKPAVKRAVAKKALAKRAAPRKAPAKKATAKKAPAKKPSTRKASARQAKPARSRGRR